MPLISSPNNERIKALKNLRFRKGLEADDSFFVEGDREIGMAIRNGFTCLRYYFCLELIDAEGTILHNEIMKLSDLDSTEITKSVFAKVAIRESSDGMIAVFKSKYLSLSDLNPKSDGLYLVTEDIEKPGNIGAILRVSDACGVDAVIISGRSADIYNPNIIRASLGTVFTLKICRADKEEILAYLKQNRVEIFVATPEAERSFYQACLSGKLAILLGSEDKGVSGFWKSHADQSIKIPMLGQVDSLNVSVAGAILLYESRRQRLLLPS